MTMSPALSPLPFAFIAFASHVWDGRARTSSVLQSGEASFLQPFRACVAPCKAQQEKAFARVRTSEVSGLPRTFAPVFRATSFPPSCDGGTGRVSAGAGCGTPSFAATAQAGATGRHTP